MPSSNKLPGDRAHEACRRDWERGGIEIVNILLDHRPAEQPVTAPANDSQIIEFDREAAKRGGR